MVITGNFVGAQVGDVIRCIHTTSYCFTEGKEYTVVPHNGLLYKKGVESDSGFIGNASSKFELVSSKTKEDCM